MSQENVEIVRRAIEAFNRRDVDALEALNHPDIAIDWSASVGPEPRIYRGQEAFPAAGRYIRSHDRPRDG